ncbi:MAG: D-aminoacyl-tRNA deacylase [Christensenellales bacterium]|jgi:D-tyrosyl-tRNA(Tyr) deacylase|nr:D-aminoacyl-tRNA deacylase [Christensenellales bacterium]
MRCVVQRVTRASVTVEGERVSEIQEGLLVLVGVGEDDGEADALYCADKIAGLRIFEDEAGRMNRSVGDVGGKVLLVSQFTLLGDARHGRRPSFSTAARPERAEPLCDRVRDRIREQGVETLTGRFRTHMEVDLLNDGPVTILLDSKRTF